MAEQRVGASYFVVSDGDQVGCVRHEVGVLLGDPLAVFAFRDAFNRDGSLAMILVRMRGVLATLAGEQDVDVAVCVYADDVTVTRWRRGTKSGGDAQKV